MKSLFFEPEGLSEEAKRNITPNSATPNRAHLMKKVLIHSRQLFDIFKFSLIYKKKASSGLQFYGMRKYTAEDDASKIDWRWIYQHSFYLTLQVQCFSVQKNALKVTWQQ